MRILPFTIATATVLALPSLAEARLRLSSPAAMPLAQARPSRLRALTASATSCVRATKRTLTLAHRRPLLDVTRGRSATPRSAGRAQRTVAAVYDLRGGRSHGARAQHSQFKADHDRPSAASTRSVSRTTSGHRLRHLIHASGHRRRRAARCSTSSVVARRTPGAADTAPWPTSGVRVLEGCARSGSRHSRDRPPAEGHRPRRRPRRSTCLVNRAATSATTAPAAFEAAARSPAAPRT